MQPWPTSDFQLLAPLIAYGDPARVREVLVRREAGELTLGEVIEQLALNPPSKSHHEPVHNGRRCLTNWPQ
jgi:hypothetical protein